MKNTFARECKTEALDNFRFSDRNCCNRSFLKGYFFRENITPETESIKHKADIFKSAKVVKKLLSQYDISSYVIEKAAEGKEPVSKLYITEAEDVSRLYTLQHNFTPCGECLKHFFIGLFVSDGIIADPEKNYSLEFTYKDENLSKELQSKLSQANLNFSAAKRRSSWVLYTKNSDTIERFLGMIGAQSAYFKLIVDKADKDYMNRQNRAANCGAANTRKTLQAGKKYIDAIYRLIDTEILYNLPDDMQELAQLKLENPGRSLTELGKMLTEPLTKSAVNRRLQKLCAIAQIEE